MNLRWLPVVFLITLAPAQAYSVLAHEAIVDTLWEKTFVPALTSRYPGLTPDQLIEAHAYAYGGAIIQDMGYYPFGSKLFSDLTHYVRSGDFTLALLREATDANETAFALGAVAHYVADNIGHPEAVNRSVPRLYPKLRAQFGPVVTYEDKPSAHIKTEFGFDVLEIAKGRYASKAYHDFIGFKVSKKLLERAFTDTYGLEMKDLFTSLDLALGTYRRSVSGIIPEMTKVAWHERQKDIEGSTPGINRRKFLYNLSQSSYEHEWGHDYERPGAGARLLAWFFKVVPKIGPFKALSYRMPDVESEKLLMKSFDDTVARDRVLIPRAFQPGFELPDFNMDTGKPTRRGDYAKADKAYGRLLEKLADRDAPTSPDLRADILRFYQGAGPLDSPKAANELVALRR